MNTTTKTAFVAAAFSILSTVASAQTVSVPVESGPKGQVNLDVGMTSSSPLPNSVGFSGSTNSGNSAGVSIDTRGNVSVSGGTSGVSGTVTTGPNGNSGSVGYKLEF